MKHPMTVLLAALLLLSQIGPGVIAREPDPSATPGADEDPFASGWAVVVLDDRLANVTVGQETVIPFKVLHMGRADSEVAEAIVVFTIRHVETDESVTEIAQLQDDRAEYEATIVLDREGQWDWTAFVYNVGSMNPQATFLPMLTAVEPGPIDPAMVTAVATPDPRGPGSIGIGSERLTPWHLEVPLGLKVMFENDSDYPVLIFVEGNALNAGEYLEPGSSVMWYSTTPGEYLFTVGPAPAFRVGTITMTGQP